jgi:hypothetical protein
MELNIEHTGEINPPQKIRSTRLNDFTEEKDASKEEIDYMNHLSLN